MKETIKTYVLFTAIAGAVLLCTYRHIFDCYAISDDYYLLFNARDGIFLEIFIQAGRSLYGVLAKWLYSKLYYICEVKYFRIGSLLGILLFSVLIYRAYVLAGWRRLEGGCAAVITCLMPAFGIYAAWATTSQVVYGISLAFIAGELCLKSYNWMILEDHRLKAIIIMPGIVLLLLISQMLYQPASPAFWLFVAIALFRPRENSEDLFRKSLYCLFVFASIVVVYFILYKATIWPFTIEPWDGRSELTSNPVEKLLWFLEYPFYDSLSLFSVLQEKVVISLAVATVSLVIVLGLYRRIMRCKQQKWQFVVIFVGLIPLSYLPNLAVSINSAAFRTQGILGSLVIFYFLLSLKEIFHSRVTRIIMPCLLVAFSLMAYKNVTYGLIEPQKQELELIRHAVKKALSKKTREIIFIRSRYSDSLVARSRYGVYGVPSTYFSWVPEGMVNLIAREVYGNAFEPIKVENYKPNKSFKKGVPVINAHKILRRFKINKFNRKLENPFDAYKKTLLLINCDKGYGGLKALHQLSFLYRPEGMVLRSHGHDPHFALPLFNFSPEKELIVKIDITSPKDTVLQLYYATKSVPHYSEKQSLRRKITKGNNVVFIKLPSRNFTGRLRLDPGNIAGEFLLHTIEIRGISKG